MIRCDETKPFIFVSYSHRDSEKVVEIMKHMRDEGYNLWYDGGIDPGTEWDENIAKHVKDCTYFIAFISKGYIGSDNCKDELNYSRDLDKDRLLVYLEDVDLPDGMAMRMNRIQAIWWNKYDASNIDEAYKKLFTTRGIDRAKVFEKIVAEDSKSAVQSTTTVSVNATTSANAPVNMAVNVPVNRAGNASTPSVVPNMKKTENPQGKKKKMPIWPFIIAGGVGILAIFLILFVSFFAIIGSGKDYEGQTLEWYMEEANEGDETAMCYLADCYFEGSNGATKDYAKAVEWYEKAAEDDNAAVEAYYGLGQCYTIGGNGIDKDNVKALTYFEKALKAGNTDAYYMIGLISFYGDHGATKDYAKAVKCFEKAIEYGNTEAYYWMGLCYNGGENGIEKDYNKAVECYEKAIENGNTDALLHMGHVYYSFSSSVQNRALAVEYYDKAVAAGITDAYYWAGLCYYYGDDTLPKDYTKCVEYAEKSAESGYAPAWITLALCYYEGENGIEQDTAKALEYYQKAEENGAQALKDEAVHMANYAFCYAAKSNYTMALDWFQKAEAISPLTSWKHLNACGACYQMGTENIEPNNEIALEYYYKALQASNCNMSIVYSNMGYTYYNMEDYNNAVKFLEEAYASGEKRASNLLGDCYYYGYGVEQDYAKAVECYMEAYNKGIKDSGSMNNVGHCYYNGLGVEQDYAKAVEYFEIGADMENKYSIYNLGLCYELGNGVAQDIEQAKKYYKMAADLGNEKAQQKLEALQ